MQTVNRAHVASRISAGITYTLKRLTKKDGKRIHRLEIDEFLADNEMNNLFLIALAGLQKDSLRLWNKEPDWLTYYSVAGLLLWHLFRAILIYLGIHGQPREEWNNYPNNEKIGSKYEYCYYSKNIFPTWHRLYIFLFEVIPLTL